ncbi:MAG TPA: dihydroorotate dehydrogenase [Vicinamibacteria bacterium]|nr:dihydroorotate dehydrogenase [Vicinamibacteria bacterium]
MHPDLSVEISGLSLTTPLIAASGTFGYGTEYRDVVDYSALGAIVVKGLYLNPRPGCPPPRIWETPSGMLNAIGLQEIGVARFIEEKLPELRGLGPAILVNICGSTLEEYGELARILNDVEGVSGIEINISCPNVKEGGILFGCDPDLAARVTEIVRAGTRLPVIPKLSPNVTDIAAVARRVESAGADALSLINTIPAMAIDVETRRPRLANVVGGLSGPAIRPIAVRLVYQTAQAVKIPVIGMGGIATAADALEFIIAGARAVQIGTMNFVDPSVWSRTLAGLEDYCRRHRLSSISELTGTLRAEGAMPSGW